MIEFKLTCVHDGEDLANFDMAAHFYSFLGYGVADCFSADYSLYNR